MLTMGKPIAIACSRAIRTLPDMLSEKILSNYQMMWLQAAPEEFLHLVTAAQVYEEMSDRAQFVIYHSTNYEQIYIQVWNQFLNRLLCYGISQFTYADQVYMEIVLRKLGLNASIFWRWFQKRHNQEYANDSPYYLYKHIYQKLHTAQITEQIKQLNHRDYEEVESDNQHLITGLKKGPVSGYQAQKIFYELEKLQKEHPFVQISMEQWQQIQKERGEHSEVQEILRAQEGEQNRILLRDEKRQRFPQKLTEPEDTEEIKEAGRLEQKMILGDVNLQRYTEETKEAGRPQQKMILGDVYLQGYTEEIKEQKREKEEIVLRGEEQRELLEKFGQQKTVEHSVLLRERNLQKITEEIKQQERQGEKEKIVLRQREKQNVLCKQQQDSTNLFFKQRESVIVQEKLELEKDQKTLAVYEDIQELKKQKKQKKENIILRQMEEVQETLEEPDRQPEQEKNAEPFGENEKYRYKEWRRQSESERLFLNQMEEVGDSLRLEKLERIQTKILLGQKEQQGSLEHFLESETESPPTLLRYKKQQEPLQKSVEQEKEDQGSLSVYRELQEFSKEIKQQNNQEEEREKYQQKQEEWRRQSESQRLFLRQIEEPESPLRLEELEREEIRFSFRQKEEQESPENVAKSEPKGREEKIILRKLQAQELQVEETLSERNQQTEQKSLESLSERKKIQEQQGEWKKQQEIQVESWKTFLKSAQKQKHQQESRERQQLELIHKNPKLAEAFDLNNRQKKALEKREIEETAKHLQREQILVRQSSQQTQELLQQETNQRFVRQQQEALQREADRLQQLLMQNLHKQVNQITNKVYGKLERRLQNERRRRGW